MKVLLIGHSYMHKAPRAKLEALGALEDLELSVLVPKRWYFEPQGLVTAEAGTSSAYDFYHKQTFFTNSEARYGYRSLGALLNLIKPDIIHNEQGEHSLSYFQANVLKQLYCPKAKTIFFTWVNWWAGRRFPHSFFSRYNLKRTDYAIAGNEEAKQLLRRRSYRGKIKVMPLWGVDAHLYEKADRDLRADLDLASFVIGYVGRLDRQKGILTLLEACSKMEADFRLLFVGRGELTDDIPGIAEQYGIRDKVKLIGVVDQEVLPSYYGTMDVLVLPSLTTPNWKEQFGHVLIEAMSCKVPVIGSNSAAIPHVIGDAGLIFQEGDSDDLCRKLISLMEDRNLRDELAERGHERVLQKYTHKRIAEETYEIYREVLSGDKSSYRKGNGDVGEREAV